MPIDAILFGGRRATVVPLVTEATDWKQGTFLGSIMASETTAAQQGAVGNLRFDPMAMLPFCGYNMADYFGHWLRLARVHSGQMPRVFVVNGVKVAPADMKELTSVDKEGWKAELPMIKEHFASFGAKMPQALKDELAALEKRLG